MNQHYTPKTNSRIDQLAAEELNRFTATATDGIITQLVRNTCARALPLAALTAFVHLLGGAAIVTAIMSAATVFATVAYAAAYGYALRRTDARVPAASTTTRTLAPASY